MKLEKIVVASGNEGKIAEIKAIFSDYEIVSMKELGFDEEIEETGKTFKENAKIKAETVAKALNLPALSDDSGLCVEGLNGAPGIYSARFSGEGPAENRKLLLKRMEHVCDRRAYFESAVCLSRTATALCAICVQNYENFDRNFGYTREYAQNNGVKRHIRRVRLHCAFGRHFFGRRAHKSAVPRQNYSYKRQLRPGKTR